jgi:glycosyltransferase involved in cell wall biosynthesis
MSSSVKSPTVSVMMPVFNSGRFVAAVVRSLLAQTYRDFELLIMDDGSRDDSPRILRDLAETDPRIRLSLRENHGTLATRNELLKLARGKYLAVNDSDDLSLPHRLERQVAFLDAHPDVAVVGGWFDMIDARGRRLTTLHPPADDAEIQRLALRGHCSICHSAGMMRRDAVERVGGYGRDFKFAHDLELWLRLGEVGKLANLPETVIQFRLHQNSISETKREEQRRFCRLACEQAWRRRGLTDVPFEAAEPWRPGKDRTSRHRYAMQYGWWAFNSGERRTAMVYGAKAVAARPMKADGWKLIAKAATKRAENVQPSTPNAQRSSEPGLDRNLNVERCALNAERSPAAGARTSEAPE